MSGETARVVSLTHHALLITHHWPVGRGAFRVREKRHRKDGVDEAEVRMPA
jgi:hypothetical protein